jgi:indole-3-glycerol phosphate synthase
MKNRTDRAARHMLSHILERKQAEIARMRAAPPLFSSRTPRDGVVQTLTRPPGQPLRLVCEIKFQSPSAGVLSRALGAADRALRYADAGASMISVLTDEPFFGGSYEHLRECRDALDATLGARRPPLLCKDFVLDPIQLDRAAGAGADAVLLIARIVTPAQLAGLAAEARQRGLKPVIEVATVEEIEPALSSGARLIGVNARDLDTLEIDRSRAAEILQAIGGRAVALHFSGLRTPDDVAEVAAGPCSAALVGEALMRQDDPSDLVRAMVQAAGGLRSAGS